MKQTAVEWLFQELERMENMFDKNSYEYQTVITQTLEIAKEMDKEQKESFAIEFYKWSISQDGQDTIHDAIMFGEISKNPTPKELFELFKKK